MKQCPICEGGKLYPKVVERKLHYSVCDYCHSEQTDNSQIRLNNDPWKEAVIDKLIVCCIYSDKHDHDARKAVNDLIAYEVILALDPQVSEDADNLLHQAPVGQVLISKDVLRKAEEKLRQIKEARITWTEDDEELLQAVSIDR